MKVKVGIVSDIHGQHEALAAAIDAMGPVDRLLCLGDSIYQFSFCNRTIGMLRDRNAVTILGNHEEAFFAGSARSAAEVDPDLSIWLASRPDRIRFEYGGARILAVHSTPWPSDHAYVPPGDARFGGFADCDADIVLYGHTHQPVVRWIDKVLVINPGSLGEGRPGANGFVRSFATLDLDTMDAQVIDLPG